MPRLRTLVDAALAGGSALLLAQVLFVAVDVSERKATVRRAEHEAREVYDAFALYYERNGEFPNDALKSRFDRVSLDPLRRRGYYRGSIVFLLVERRADAYDSPDDRGTNQEFWLEVTVAEDPIATERASTEALRPTTTPPPVAPVAAAPCPRTVESTTPIASEPRIVASVPIAWALCPKTTE